MPAYLNQSGLTKLDPSVYRIAWFCCTDIAFKAAEAFLDQRHADPARELWMDLGRECLFGTMRPHNVIIVGCGKLDENIPSKGTVGNLTQKFRSIRIVLSVGDVDASPNNGHHIRLGDVLVGTEVATIIDGKKDLSSFTKHSSALLRSLEKHQAERIVQAKRLLRIIENDSWARSFISKRNSLGKASVIDLGTTGPERFNIDPRPSEPVRNFLEPVIRYGVIAFPVEHLPADQRIQLTQEKGYLWVDPRLCSKDSFECLLILGAVPNLKDQPEWRSCNLASTYAAAYAKDFLRHLSSGIVNAETTIGQSIFAPVALFC